MLKATGSEIAGSHGFAWIGVMTLQPSVWRFFFLLPARNACNVPANRPVADSASGPGGASEGPERAFLAPCTGRAEKSISWTPHRRDMPFGCAPGRGARYLRRASKSALPLSGWGPKVWTPTAPSTPGEPETPHPAAASQSGRSGRIAPTICSFGLLRIWAK